MGEYADVIGTGVNVKIGTCENLYYLRADDRHKVDYRFSPEALQAFRFRFPWPDEDGLTLSDRTPCFMGVPDYDRGLEVPAFDQVAEGEQCAHRSTYASDDCGVQSLVQEKVLADGRIVPVLRCACGGRYRIEDAPEIERLVAAIRSLADSKGKAAISKGTLHEVANRVAAHAQITPDGEVAEVVTLNPKAAFGTPADSDVLESLIGVALLGTREARIEIIKRLAESL